MDPQFAAQKVGNRLLLDRKDLYDLYVKGLDEGDRKIIVIKSPVRTKTIEQLGYYHAVVKPHVGEGLRDATGEPLTLDDADQVLSRMFLTVSKGSLLERVKSKADLTQEEMKEFIQQCIRFAAEYLGTIIPLPRGEEILI